MNDIVQTMKMEHKAMKIPKVVDRLVQGEGGSFGDASRVQVGYEC